MVLIDNQTYNNDNVYVCMYVFQDCSMFVSCSTGIVQSLMSSSEHFGNLEELEKGLKSLSDTLSKCGLTSGHAKVQCVIGTFAKSQFTSKGASCEQCHVVHTNVVKYHEREFFFIEMPQLNTC